MRRRSVPLSPDESGFAGLPDDERRETPAWAAGAAIAPETATASRLIKNKTIVILDSGLLTFLYLLLLYMYNNMFDSFMNVKHYIEILQISENITKDYDQDS